MDRVAEDVSIVSDFSDFRHDDVAGDSGSELPSVVREALQQGRSIIPIQANKKPANGFPWEGYQTKRASSSDLEIWDYFYHSRTAWAVVTGEISGIFVLDFDCDDGLKTLEQLVLQPHVKSPRGAHVYVKHPGWRVSTVNGKSDQKLARQFPGLDVKGDGGYAIFEGSSVYGSYERISEHEPYAFEDLPEHLKAFLRGERGSVPSKTHQEPQCQNVDCALLLRRALEKARAGNGRNNSGAWLAQQLRDHRLSKEDAKVIMLRYVAQVPERDAHGDLEPYTEREATDSLNSAYSRAPREPWDALGTEASYAKPPDSPFRLVSVGDLEAEGPLQPLIDDVLYAGTVNLIYGPSGGGKTFVVIDQAMSLATGTDWHGRGVMQGTVVYIAAEGKQGIPQRVRAWQAAHDGLSDENFLVLAGSPQLSNPQHVTNLIAAISELPKPPVALYVDTLAQTFGDGNENDTRDMMRFVKGAQRLQEELGTTVVVVHHTGRSGDDPRGNSALDAALQTVIRVEPQARGIKVSSRKQKDGVNFDPMWFHLKPVTLGDGRSSAVITSVDAPVVAVKSNPVDALSEKRRKVYDALQDTGPQGATQAQVATATGLHPSTVSEALNYMLRDGLVEKRETPGAALWAVADEYQAAAA